MPYRSTNHFTMKNKRKLYRIIGIVCFAIMLICLGAIAAILITNKKAGDDYAKLASEVRMPTETPTQSESETKPTEPTTQPSEPTEPELVDIPIDFDALLETNEDIIGWITVDGTNIDYPILYDDSLELYYLSHNYLGTWVNSGSIFVLSDNTRDFSDFNTLIYGHNLLDGQMFSQLHNFREEDFFQENGHITIYTPDRKLSYEVFAAYRTDNLNIVLNNDFSTEETREAYIERIYDHTDYAFFKPEYRPTASDTIITLSTCIGVGQRQYRYVVQGLLICDEAGQFAAVQDEDTP